MLRVCNEGACRLRASDLGLDARDGAPMGCVGRCDVPVAAERDGRALVVVARGRVEPWRAPALPMQPRAPVVLAARSKRESPGPPGRQGENGVVGDFADRVVREWFDVDGVEALRARAPAGHDTILCAVSGDVLRPGLYELDGGATVEAALRAAGGVVDGVRVSTPGYVVVDGERTSDWSRPAAVSLVAYNVRRV